MAPGLTLAMPGQAVKLAGRMRIIMMSDLPLIFLQQPGANWRPDLFSLLIGLLAGILLTVTALRSLPLIRQFWGRTVRRVRETEAWVRSGVEQRFQLEVATYVERHHLGGDRATLPEIFVEPRLLAPPPEATPETFEAAHNPDELHYIWPDLTAVMGLPPPPSVSLRQLLLNGRRTLLAAESGAGKSTLLAYCAHLCAQANNSSPYTFLLPVLPVFVHLADLPLEAPELAEDPAWALSQPLVARSSPLTGPGLDKLLHDKLAAGQVLLLLDGLDEASPQQMAAAAAWLETLFNLYPDIRFIAAAPLQGYGPFLQLGCLVSGLLPWRVGQADHFGELWSAALGEKPLRRPQYWQPGISPLATTLRYWQRRAEAANPEAVVTSVRQIELLEAQLRLRLPTHEKDPEWLAPASRDLWQELAYQLRHEERLSLPAEAVRAAMSSILQVYEVEEGQGITPLQKTLTASALFVTNPDNSVRFLSPIWRDFLAAAYMAQAQLHEQALSHLDDPHWHQLLFFYVGRVGVGDLPAELLAARRDDPLYENLFRLTSWLPEMLDKGEWRRQVLIRLGQMVIKSSLPYALRHRAAFALAYCGEPGTPAFLNQLMRQDDSLLRQTAAACLAVLGSDAALGPLEKLMGDSEAGVRRAAVHALGWLADPAAEKLLVTALVDADDTLNLAAAEALAHNGPEGFEILREALTESALHIRRAAVYGLAELDSYEAVQLLENTELEDEQWIVKSAAQNGLQAIASRNRYAPWQPTTPGDQSWLITWQARHGETVPGGLAALPVLLETLHKATEDAIRTTAALSLARLVLPDSLPALHHAMHDRSAAVRNATFVALCQLQRAYQNAFQL
jgi:HEAT repeat protein